MQRLWASLLVVVLAATTNHSLFHVKAQQQEQGDEIPFFKGDPNFLFIGNSYTSSNGLANMVAGILKEGIPEWESSMDVKSVNPGGWKLHQHVEDLQAGGVLQGLLVNNPDQQWKWVVLQDQSQVPGFYQWDEVGSEYYSSRVAAHTLNNYVEQNGGQTMFFMTWGRRDGDNRNPEIFPDFLTMQGMLTEGYMEYLAATSTPERPTYMAPVGLVFQTIFNDLVNEGIVPTEGDTLFRALYSGDGSHPSAYGSFAAALTIYTSMTGLDPTEINGFPSSVDEARGRAIQEAVRKTVLETAESGYLIYPWNSFPTTTIEDSVTEGEPVTTEIEPTTIEDESASGSLTFQLNNPLPSPSFSPTFVPPTGSPTEMPTLSITAADPSVTPESNSTVLKGSLTVEISYDMYPEDIAWTLIPKGGGDALFFQPYNSNTTPFSNQSITFDNLEPNQAYLFQISDKAGDGLCCNHGDGYVKIFDNNKFGRNGIGGGTEVFLLAGDLTAYYEVDLQIGSYGVTNVIGRAVDYTLSTWPALESMWLPLGVYETDYFGYVPTFATWSVVVNIALDNNPEEVSWVLQFQNSSGLDGWTTVFSWNGGSSSAGTLNSTEIGGLKEGWYRFSVQDSRGNGLCCNDGNVFESSNNINNTGYVALTGPLAATKQFGLVWGNSGQYEFEDEIAFQVDMEGYIPHLSFPTNKDARSPSPSVAPSTSPTGAMVQLQKIVNSDTRSPDPSTSTTQNSFSNGYTPVVTSDDFPAESPATTDNNASAAGTIARHNLMRSLLVVNVAMHTFLFFL